MPSWRVAPSSDQLGDVPADPPLDVADRRAGVDVRRDVDLDGQVDVVDVDEAVAERPRHRPVELHDDGLRGADRGVHRLDARAQRAEAMGVGRRRVHEHDVERERAALEQPRDVREEDRDVVRAALAHGPSRVRPDEQRPMPEVALHLRGQVRTRTLRVQVDDRHVAELVGTGHEGVQQHRRRGCRAVHVHAIARSDDRHGFLGRDEAHQYPRGTFVFKRDAPFPADHRACRAAIQRAGWTRRTGHSDLMRRRVTSSTVVMTTSWSGTCRIRPIAPGDREELARFYADLSLDSLEARFHGASRGIGDGMARFFCGPDHEHREGLVAECTDAVGRTEDRRPRLPGADPRGRGRDGDRHRRRLAAPRAGSRDARAGRSHGHAATASRSSARRSDRPTAR